MESPDLQSGQLHWQCAGYGLAFGPSAVDEWRSESTSWGGQGSHRGLCNESLNAGRPRSLLPAEKCQATNLIIHERGMWLPARRYQHLHRLRLPLCQTPFPPCQKAASKCAQLVTSVASKITRGPSGFLLRDSTVASYSGRNRRSAITTLQPRSYRALANAKLIPDPAPVTSAMAPCKLTLDIVHS